MPKLRSLGIFAVLTGISGCGSSGSPQSNVGGTTSNPGTGGTNATAGAVNGGAAVSTGGVNGGAGGSTASDAGSSGVGGAVTTSICATSAENHTATLTCPSGSTITAIDFASFGTATGECGGFVEGECEAADSRAVVEAACLGQSTCSLRASNADFGGDPCSMTVKHLDVQATCTQNSGGVGGAGGGGEAGNSGGTGSNGGGSGTWNEGTELKAFPTAEGYGRHSKGGRGGKVIEVTTLADSGPGSLREAVAATGPRTIVFKVAGAIELKSRITISASSNNGSVTIAGQTAPGKGIQVRNYSLGMSGGEDVIMRFVRVGIGGVAKAAMDGMGMRSANNSIYDHCSISWTIDEGFSSRDGKNLTLQRSMITECLNESYHYDDSTEDHTGTQPHGYAASINGGIGSFHHNLLAHCAGRNWSVAGNISKDGKKMTGELDIRNNVIYNWINRTTDGEIHQLNFVNNYYKPGPASKHFEAITLGYYEWVPDQASWYISGNVMPGHFTASETAKSFNWGDAVQTSWLKNAPLYEPNVVTQSAEEGYANVLANVGANVPRLDDHDKRVIDEVKNGTYKYKGSKGGQPGIIDDEADAGGFETFAKEERPADWDTDHDGIPGDWETAHGLDPSEPTDGSRTSLSKLGYTNLEMYLNELAGDFK